MKLVKSTIALVVPHRQFNDAEYNTTRSALEAEGCRIKVAAASLQPAQGAAGTVVRPQILFSDLKPGDFDGIAFIGGLGAKDFWNHPRAHNVVRDFDTQGKLLGAICVAPVTIANTGLMKDRKGTCHGSVRKEFEAAGAVYCADHVVVDGRIVTASGPDAAEAFAAAIIGMLQPETA